MVTQYNTLPGPSYCYWHCQCYCHTAATLLPPSPSPSPSPSASLVACSLVESMPGDNPRNLINTQVHGSKLSRQSIMYVTPLPPLSPAQSTFLPSGISLSFDFASPASHVSVCGSHINTSFICLPGPETKTATATVFVPVTESRGLRAFCTHCSQYTVRNTEFFPVVVSLSVFHTRFNWLLYLWSQFASILAFN